MKQALQIQKKLTSKDYIVNKTNKSGFAYAYSSYAYMHAFIDEATGGGVKRLTSKELTEGLVNKLITDCCKSLGASFNLVHGSTDKVVIKNKAGEISVGVDWHLYIDDKLVLVVECKSYTDKPFMERADVNMKHLKGYHGEELTTFLVSMENAIDEEALNYYMASGGIDSSYFLMNGKRSSKKPVYKKEHFRPVRANTMKVLVEDIYDVVSKSI